MAKAFRAFPAKLCRDALHQFYEFAEQIVAVVWSGSCFWMVLHSEGWVSLMSNSFDGLVVQIDMGDFNVVWQSLFFKSEAVVLRCDFHFACLFIQNRLIGSSMPKRQFESFASAGKAQQLQS